MNEPQVQTNAKKKFLQWAKTHPAVLSIFILVLVVLLTVWALCSAWDEKRKLAQQLEEQTGQMESRLEEIDKLREDIRVLEEEKAAKSIYEVTTDTVRDDLAPLGKLITQEYIYTNSVRWEEWETWIFDWKRPLSDSVIMVTYDGTIMAGIDLSRVQITVSDEQGAVTVSLPASEVIENKIPQESITVVDVKNGLFNKVTLDEYNRLMATEKIKMQQKAIDRGLLEKADEEARRMVEVLLGAMPYIGNGEGQYTLVIQ